MKMHHQDIGVELGIEDIMMPIMKSGKRKIAEGMDLYNQDCITAPEENENYTLMGIREADNIKQVEMKDIIRKL